MFVVFNMITGWSEESMRFGTKREAQDWIADQAMPEEFEIREED